MSQAERNWIMHIKDVRAKRGVSILEAERVALDDPKWRRWCEIQVISDDTCLKYAKSHIRIRGENAIFRLRGRKMIFDDQTED